MEEAPDAGALVKIKILPKTKSSFSLYSPNPPGLLNEKTKEKTCQSFPMEK
jgi:hypothetical protein